VATAGQTEHEASRCCTARPLSQRGEAHGTLLGRRCPFLSEGSERTQVQTWLPERLKRDRKAERVREDSRARDYPAVAYVDARHRKLRVGRCLGRASGAWRIEPPHTLRDALDKRIKLELLSHLGSPMKSELVFGQAGFDGGVEILEVGLIVESNQLVADQRSPRRTRARCTSACLLSSRSFCGHRGWFEPETPQPSTDLRPLFLTFGDSRHPHSLHASVPLSVTAPQTNGFRMARPQCSHAICPQVELHTGHAWKAKPAKRLPHARHSQTPRNSERHPRGHRPWDDAVERSAVSMRV
jgi:hypothetical protein